MKAQNDKTRTLTKAGKFGPITLTVSRFDVLYFSGPGFGPFAVDRQTSYSVSGDGLGNMGTSREKALRRWNES